MPPPASLLCCRWCWYQCTVKGGREARDLDARALVVACEALGAGEILLNCMDKVCVYHVSDVESAACKSREIYCLRFVQTVEFHQSVEVGKHIESPVQCMNAGSGFNPLSSTKDGTNSGFEHELVSSIKTAVSIPVIASSGVRQPCVQVSFVSDVSVLTRRVSQAGQAQHFVDVFRVCDVDAALAAGIFHRREVSIESVKECLRDNDIACR